MVMILSGQPAAALIPAGAHRPRVLRRAKIVAAVFAATLVIGSGLAFAGALPGGTQDAAAKMFAKLGITVPRHDKGSQSTKPGPGPDVTGPAKFGLCQAFSSGQGGVVCAQDVEHDAGRASLAATAWLDLLARTDLEGSGEATPAPVVRKEARALLYGFTEYHLERRMRSFTLLARQPQPASVVPAGETPAPALTPALTPAPAVAP